LFWANGSSATKQGKIYSCRIYDSGVIVRDFVPCVNPNGDVGLYDVANDKFYGNAGTGKFICDLSFENCAWEQIITACQNNTIPSCWTVGDQKTMTIDGSEYAVDIIGKHHDAYVDDSGTAPLTLQLHDCYKTSYKMNASQSATGGWEKCLMRTESMPIVLSKMPAEVQLAIREVKKTSSVGGQSYSVSATADKLFLLSEVETFGTTTYSASGEGRQYEYYKAGNTARKPQFNDLGNITGCSHWLRSAPTNSNVTFVAVGGNADPGAPAVSGRANYSAPIAFAFCF
jgi:hypothetical protein